MSAVSTHKSCDSKLEYQLRFRVVPTAQISQKTKSKANPCPEPELVLSLEFIVLGSQL